MTTPLEASRTRPLTLLPTAAQMLARRGATVDVAWRFHKDPITMARAWACVLETEDKVTTLGAIYDTPETDGGAPSKASAAWDSAQHVLPLVFDTARHTRADHLVIRVNNSWVRSTLEQITRTWAQPTTRLLPIDHTPRGRRLDTMAMAHIGARLDAYAPRRQVLAERQRPLVIATDGSARHVTREAAWAWVCADGHCDTGVLRGGSAFLAELNAITSAVEYAARIGRAVHIISDCENAASVARRHLEDPRVIHGGPRQREILRRLVAAGRGTTVTMEVVRAHRGHHLNELADRLAVLARRDADAGVPGTEHRRRASTIAAHALAPAA